MTPRTEFRDLISRSRTLFAAVLLLLITAAMLLVAAANLFCAIWIALFSAGRGIVDRWTAWTKAPKEVPDAA